MLRRRLPGDVAPALAFLVTLSSFACGSSQRCISCTLIDLSPEASIFRKAATAASLTMPYQSSSEPRGTLSPAVAAVAAHMESPPHSFFMATRNSLLEMRLSELTDSAMPDSPPFVPLSHARSKSTHRSPAAASASNSSERSRLADHGSSPASKEAWMLGARESCAARSWRFGLGWVRARPFTKATNSSKPTLPDWLASSRSNICLTTSGAPRTAKKRRWNEGRGQSTYFLRKS